LNRGRGGFTFPEVLCALAILTLAILGALMTISHTLSVTVNFQNHMSAFSSAERAGVVTMASQKQEPDRAVDLTSATIDCPLSIGGTTRTTKMELLAYVEKKERKAYQLLQNPVFVVFLRTAP
jgi:prepilin-type N-terminal cleavage/methylation domain-containing protein